VADNRNKSKLLPALAVLAVIVVGVVGLTRGCSYASAPTPAETRGQAQRDAPDD
jgi:hypothetical protein